MILPVLSAVLIAAVGGGSLIASVRERKASK
jgi:hypothetical protein